MMIAATRSCMVMKLAQCTSLGAGIALAEWLTEVTLDLDDLLAGNVNDHSALIGTDATVAAS